MTKTKINQTKNISVTSVIAITSLIASTILFFAVFSERARLDTLYDQQVRQSMDNFYKASRITFCYDNAIHPCTDDAIAGWNSTHSNDVQFSTVSPRLVK